MVLTVRSRITLIFIRFFDTSLSQYTEKVLQILKMSSATNFIIPIYIIYIL